MGMFGVLFIIIISSNSSFACEGGYVFLKKKFIQEMLFCSGRWCLIKEAK